MKAKRTKTPCTPPPKLSVQVEWLCIKLGQPEKVMFLRWLARHRFWQSTSRTMRQLSYVTGSEGAKAGNNTKPTRQQRITRPYEFTATVAANRTGIDRRKVVDYIAECVANGSLSVIWRSNKIAAKYTTDTLRFDALYIHGGITPFYQQQYDRRFNTPPKFSPDDFKGPGWIQL
jgi:hypothetical protein